MANYSTAAWSAFQYKLNELMNMPEFKSKPSPALMAHLRNTDFLIPATQKEAALGTKQSDQDTVYLNIINKQSITTGSARAYDHDGSKNDSTRVTASFTTYTADFDYSIKEADRNIWALAEIVSKQIYSAVIALHSSIETAALATLNTNKSQVVVSTSPRSGAWDSSNYIFQIAATNKEYWMQKVKGFMREQYYKSQVDAIVDEYLYQEAERILNQGAGNATNLSWQSALGMKLGETPTQELTLDAGYVGMGYVFPLGTIGVLPWIPRLNQEGYGDIGANGGFYTTMPDPLGSGLTFAVHQYQEGADNESASGETQDIDVHTEISIDLSFIKAPMSTANASPIFKFGLLQ